jgi:[acyl-carrier-protein] S-malonyltransferase
MITAVVICPGRGTYNRTELGYLHRHHGDGGELLIDIDKYRTERGLESVIALDRAQAWSGLRQGAGRNAAALIFACTLADFLAIDRSTIEVVAITGNSMGWYSALACAGALSPGASFELVDTMAMLMDQHMIGGQLVYPFVDDDWRHNAQRKAQLLSLVSSINASSDQRLALSIDLGGMLVLAGNDKGLRAFEADVERLNGKFPMRLANHAAFHTELQTPVAAEARTHLIGLAFQQPVIPLVDGRGAIWWPDATDHEALREYTLGQQVTETYDFSRAMRNAAREFAPDLFIVTGPGRTLGSAVAQSLIHSCWRGLVDKSDFMTRQSSTPVIAAMGVYEQRRLVTQG